MFVPCATLHCFLQPSWAFSALSSAGGVLLAKTATGELAWGDVWFNGITTRNPWNINTGSCGSSAGSAVAVAAGEAGKHDAAGMQRECCPAVVEQALCTCNCYLALINCRGSGSRWGAMQGVHRMFSWCWCAQLLSEVKSVVGRLPDLNCKQWQQVGPANTIVIEKLL
jgi:hypothetical protein